MIYTKEAYDIDLNTLIPKIKEIINTQPLSSSLKISKPEYYKRIEYGADYLKSIRQYNNEPYFIVHVNEPSFNFWLAFFLSTEKAHRISLILDLYIKKYHNQDDFINLVQHDVLHIIDNNIFHNVDTQLMEIANWVREKRNGKNNETIINVQVLNINVTVITLQQTFNNAWHTDPNSSEDADNNEDPFKDGLIQSPYGNLLFEGLQDFCEDSSLSNLKKLLMGQKIDSPVILKSNFKKTSLIRPITELVARGHLSFNNKETAQWIFDNFKIRAKIDTTAFSVGSIIRLMSNRQVEPKNAQIKYEHWFENN